MPNWTEDQLEAITSRGKGIIVTAAAGSGKTAVLVERTIRILCDAEEKVPADRLLAVTFTNDAAAQMRGKLASALAERIRLEPKNEWLKLQQQRLALAQITTINSFCYNFVKEHIHAFDYDGNISICDENNDLTILNDALTESVEEFYNSRAEDMRFLLDSLCLSGDKEIFDAVKTLHRFFESIPFKQSWISAQREKYLNEEFWEKLYKSIKDEISEKLKFLIVLLDGVQNKALEISSTQAPFEVVSGDIEGLNGILSALPDLSLSKLRETLSGFRFERYRGTKKGDPDEDKLISEEIKNSRSNIKKQFEALPDLITADEETTPEDREYCLKIFNILIDLEEDVSKRANDAKRQAGLVSFSDVEHMTIELLLENENERTPLCEEIVKNRDYEVILIDEFQDVNNLQDLIFKALSDTDDLSVIGKNVFVVGDMKQSIYRFRLSNPKLFDNVKRSAEASPDRVKRIALKKNFRSRSSVVDAVNYFFESLMTPDTGEIDYRDESERLVSGANFDKAEDSPIEVDIIHEEEKSDKLDKFYGFDNEQLAVANRIAELIRSGAKADGRPCRQGDFCILTRGRAAHKGIAAALKFVGLNCSFETSDGYLKSREIAVLLNLLKVIDNPLSDIALLSVLMSPVFMFTADDVALLRSLNPKAKLFLNLVAFNKLEEKSSELSKKARRAYETIQELRLLSAGLSTAKLIRKIYDITGFYAAASVFKDSARRDNLTLFLTYAGKYDESSGKGLSGFLRYINSVFENGGDFKRSEKNLSLENAVTVTTMHSSKGLEYPFVFLLDLDKKMNLSDATGKIIVSEELGVSFAYRNVLKHERCEPLHYTVLKQNYIKENISEEIRILYVAMTRAKERLFLPIYLNPANLAKLKSLAFELTSAGGISPQSVRATDGMLRWVLLPLLEHEDMKTLRALSDADFTFHELKSEGSFFERVITPSKTPYKVSLFEMLDGIESDDEINPDFSYDDSLITKPAKLSVSEVVKEDKDFTFYPQIPRFSEEIGKFTAAERGTIAHGFMEICDFKSAGTDLRQELSRLVAAGKISKKKADVIDLKSVSGFFESELYSRIESSPNVMREKPFLVRIADLNTDLPLASEYKNTDGMLQGIADLIFEEEDGYVLVDYKTDRAAAAEALTENYSEQLKLYKAAFDRLLDKPVKSAFIYSFFLGKTIELAL